MLFGPTLRENTMQPGHYRIKYPIHVRFPEDEVCVSGIVPTGAFITLEAIDGNKIVEATWDGKRVMVPGQELLAKSELLVDEMPNTLGWREITSPHSGRGGEEEAPTK